MEVCWESYLGGPRTRTDGNGMIQKMGDGSIDWKHNVGLVTWLASYFSRDVLSSTGVT